MNKDKHERKEQMQQADSQEVKEVKKPSPEDKLKEAEDRILRLKAEFENTKKRLEKEKFEVIKFSNEQLIVDILPIMDNLDRAMVSLSEGHDPEKVKEGLKIAQEELHKVLERYGIEAIKSVGEVFDPKVHEAIAVVETEDKKEDSIIDEIQRGYLLNGRLIRPSQVRVAKNKE